MKFDNFKAFEKHLEGASPNHFAQVYLIMGKEPFDCKEALNLLLSYLFPKQRELALYHVEGGSINPEHLITELNSSSFLAPKRGFVIHQADKIKKPIQEELENYILNPVPSHFLILAASTLAKNSSFYKKIEKEGIVVEFAEVKSWEKEKRLVEWVSKKATASRKNMSHQASQFFVKQIGTDQEVLAQEFEKLLCYLGERSEITVQDIGRICSNLSVDTIWQLGESIFRCETSSALKTCRGLLDEGNALLPLLRQIRSQFQTGYTISTILSNNGSGEDVAKIFPYMKGQILERNMQQARSYGSSKYKKGLLLLDDAEMQIKNSQIEETLLAELLIIKLTTP